MFLKSLPNSDPLSKVQNQIKDVKNVAMKNIEKVLERGEKIDLLVDKTDRMRNTAVKFHKTSRRLKNTIWCHRSSRSPCAC